jgi:hypothetical protein
VGAAGWAIVVLLALQLGGASPSRLGFDLQLLLDAGRRVAGGASPYDPAMLAGQSGSAVDLFYSYPPPIAQYLGLFATVPSGVMLVAWAALAVAGLGAIAIAMDLVTAPRVTLPVATAAVRRVAVPVLTMAPFAFPFAIAIVFGNFDALFPLLYGLMLLGALLPSLAARFGAGASLAVASIAKVHPTSMGIWFLARGLRDRRRGARTPGGFVVFGAAVAVGLAILVVSLIAGGVEPWSDYLTVLRVGSDASIVDARNVGPAAQLALLTGAGETAARLIHVVVAIVAVGGTAIAAWSVEDTLESFGIATVASLVVLPITWYHYPVALLPVAIAAWLRTDAVTRRRVAACLAFAIALSVVAVGLPVLVWTSVALVLLAVHWSLPSTVAVADEPRLEPSRVTRFPLPGEGPAR